MSPLSIWNESRRHRSDRAGLERLVAVACFDGRREPPVVFRASTSGPLPGGGHALETTVPGCQTRPSKWFDHQTKCRASSRSEDMRRMNQLEGDRHPPDRRMSIADTIDSARCAFESAARGGRPYLNLAPEMLVAQVVIHDERGSTCPGGGRRSDRCARAWLPLRRRRRAAAMPRRRLHVPGWIGLDGPSASA